MNLPNLITVVRMLLAFVFLYFGLQDRWDAAFPIFCIAAFTDLVDGAIARAFRQRTQLGGFLDPTADKLLMFFGFIALTRHDYLPLWLMALVVARDLMISIGLVILKVKKVVIIFRPTYLSKLTTLAQISTIIATLVLTRNHYFQQGGWTDLLRKARPGILALTGVLTFVTAIQYTLIGIKMIPQTKKKT